MARRTLSLEEQLRGVRAAIKSRRTPPQLREGLKRRAEELERKLKASGQMSHTSTIEGAIRELLGF